MPKNRNVRRNVRQRGGLSKKTREGEGSKQLYKSASGRQRRQQANKGRNRRGRETLNPYEMAERVGWQKYINRVGH
jgi:hypothetical protein